MSIFKESFPSEIDKQIKKRQELLTRRTPQDLSYLNSRKAWVRLTSGVNIDNTNTLARQYVLQGGTLKSNDLKQAYTGSLKAGIGEGINNAYSTTTPSGKKHKLGIRPMPGITNVDIKSKSAYGSLREATVNFVCWDITQLEDLELLYMRPGFTILLEWGWTPYIANNDKYTTLVKLYDKFISGDVPKSDTSLQDIYKEIHNLSLSQSGNYDALIGYIKNFQWSFRADGGYDCSTTVISFGEVLESLKINYSTPTISVHNKIKGFLGIESNEFSKFYPEVYNKGKLAGILYEIASYLATKMNALGENATSANNGVDFSNTVFNGDNYNLFALDLVVDQKNSSNTSDSSKTVSFPQNDKFQYYITLESFCNLLNKYILVTSDRGSLGAVSTLDRTYYNPNFRTSTQKALTQADPITGQPIVGPFQLTPPPPPPINLFGLSPSMTQQPTVVDTTPRVISAGNSLLCLAQPLQLSVDPSVCLIKSPIWLKGFNAPKANENVDDKTPGVVDPTLGNDNLKDAASNLVQRIIDYGIDTSHTDDDRDGKIKDKIKADLVNYFSSSSDINEKEKALQELIKQYEIKRGGKTKVKYTINGDTIETGDGPDFKSSKTGKKPIVTSGNELGGVDVNALFPLGGFLSFYEFANKSYISIDNVVTQLNLDKDGNNLFYTYLNKQSITSIAATVEDAKTKNKASQDASDAAKTNLKFMEAMSQPFFKNDDPLTGLGYISNIYINLNYLYTLSLNENLESLDRKEKNEISLYDYLKSIMSAVQSSIGNVNNFDIHVDPIDSIGRVIDINFSTDDPIGTFKNATEINIQGLNTIAKNVNLQSQIYPEQSSIVAISAQNGGGTLGLDNTTLVGFNQGIVDRILPTKYAPKTGNEPPTQLEAQKNNILTSVGSLASYFIDLKSLYVDSVFTSNIHAKFNTSNASDYKNALKELIVAIKIVADDPNQFKSIIPTKLSLTMDGIGGIIIGNLFKIPDSSLPRGYKGENGIGRKVGYLVNGLSHKIDTGFWETTIDSQMVILEPNEKGKGKLKYEDIIVQDPVTGEFGVKLGGSDILSDKKALENFGKVDNSIPNWGKAALDMISYTEGTAKAGQNGYDVLFSYKTIPGWTSDTIVGHPNIPIPFGATYSTAGGRYGFLYSVWVESNGGINAPFNKANQDKQGFKLILGRASKNDLENAYNTAKTGVTDVTQNSSFLNILGSGKKGFAGGWASIPDRTGAYQYSGQSSSKGIQDIYNIYLKAVESNT